jgi:DNA-binding ferritin-like protein
VQTREGSHARLLEERIKELGGSPKHEIPEAIYQQVMEGAGSAERTDVEKVKEFVERFPDIDEALRPIHQLADRLDDDQETQFLLRSIAQDERATLELLQDACKLLST